MCVCGASEDGLKERKKIVIAHQTKLKAQCDFCTGFLGIVSGTKKKGAREPQHCPQGFLPCSHPELL